jgi:hypothetical protein
MNSLLRKLVALLLIAPLGGCATIHRHPKATALIVGSVVGVSVGLALHGHSCSHYINGVYYDGTPPCPTDCDKSGVCYWPK